MVEHMKHNQDSKRNKTNTLLQHDEQEDETQQEDERIIPSHALR
jgi:hypothetical protein